MSEKVFRLKLRVLLKRQIRREAKFQKALTILESSIKKYVENKLKRENLFKLIEDARRVSFFHVDALRDIISNLHSPHFIEDDESVVERMMTPSPADVSGQARQPRLALQAGEDGLYPQKVRLNE